MLLPYQPDYKQDQLKVPGTSACVAGTCNGQHSHQVTPLTVNVCEFLLILLITHQYIQTIVSFYSLLINYFGYILWNENFRQIRLNFHVCVQISVALFLPSPLSRYFCDIVILRDRIYSLSSIKATTNHYSYRNSIIVK